jgi:hypothetical membrane protein
MTSSTLSNRSLANAALAGLAAFPVIVVALHVVQRGQYHPLSDAVSELALGRAGWLMWIAFCGAGTGLICLGILHRRLVERPRSAPVLLATAGLLAYVSAVFHADPENATTTSLHDEIHQTASLIAFVLLIIAMFISSRRFRLDPRWQHLARPTLIWAICAVAALLLALDNGSYFGVGQRIFILSWLTWAIVISARARTIASDSPRITAEPREAMAA